jgi:hypothetical protein
MAMISRSSASESARLLVELVHDPRREDDEGQDGQRRQEDEVASKRHRPAT